jgi:hypothetical protein
VIFEHLREKFGVDPTHKIGTIDIPADDDGL